jgi:hypothetical protein
MKMADLVSRGLTSEDPVHDRSFRALFATA